MQVMHRNAKVLCPVCDCLVTLDGTTNGQGKLILPWHIREGWKRCEGSYRTSAAADGVKKRPGIRGRMAE